ncbi:DNA-binding MarR family transcriptional regulator [Motilibacter rhizosphaerae]|uniref:DNA-binding MarR family transcriptional regulator n=1 Tax=Motilibacter rhizosphaerae TaxID=598652 RepID=A0A4V2F497_9ACTN|nr:MarR family winged helix-turn-helix transcriptional regulator [Motilibacter rhizosphaerae]RZS86847.1 DNA-binding MarR family transcriptional regulator [Motilibacter rhizosphaerae]
MDLGLPELLLVVTRGVFERVHEQLAAEGHDIRPAHGFAFQLIASAGGASGADVAAHLGITKQAAAQLLDGLERAGYVTRGSDPSDHRARPAVLTERGWECIRHGERLWRESEREAVAVLGADAYAALRESLARLAGAGGMLEPPLRLKPVW